MYLEQMNQDYKQLRKKGGLYLKKLRESAGLTQRELAVKLGLNYYTFISQIESGKGRVPPDQYEKWAAALGVNVSEFVRKLLVFYDPMTFQALFGTPRNEDVSI